MTIGEFNLKFRSDLTDLYSAQEVSSLFKIVLEELLSFDITKFYLKPNYILTNTELEKINKFAPIKHILKNNTNKDNQVIELLDDISKDLFNYDLEFRIQELESRFSEDMSETTFNELKLLKNERKIN